MDLALELPVRTYHWESDPDVVCDEANFRHVERLVSFPLTKAVFVLIDIWDRNVVASYLERTLAIVERCIVPALDAARGSGLNIVHAPAPPIAAHYPDHRYADDLSDDERRLFQRNSPVDWPPLAFRRREGEYARYDVPNGPWFREMVELEAATHIVPLCEPLPGEYVVETGAELHRYCKDRGVLHVVYAGFAANACLQYRDYGVRAFAESGYHVIFLRDSTTAIEGPDTLDGLYATRQAIIELETGTAGSATSEAFIAACKRVTSTSVVSMASSTGRMHQLEETQGDRASR